MLTTSIHLEEKQSQENNAAAASSPQLPPYVLKKRLEMFLEVFAAIPSPKQLFEHQLLYSFYHVLVSKSDPAIAKLSLDCILAFKPPAYQPFADAFKGLMVDSKIRGHLITFDLDAESGAIDKTLRPEVISLVTRILYGKFSSKVRGGRAARDQSLSW